MHEQVADEHDVERAEHIGIEVVHAHRDALDRRAEDLVRELEAGAGRAVETERRRVRQHEARHVAVGPTRHVERHHLGAAPFELERPEPVEGRDVEHAQPRERRRQRVVGQLVAVIDEPRRDHSVPEVDGVVPLLPGDALDDGAALGVDVLGPGRLDRNRGQKVGGLEVDDRVAVAVPVAAVQHLVHRRLQPPVDRVGPDLVGELGRHADGHLDRSYVHALLALQTLHRHIPSDTSWYRSMSQSGALSGPS